NDDFRRTIGFVADAQCVSGFNGGRGLDVDLEATLFDVRCERDDAVTERADENFLGIERAHESNADVSAAFEAFGQANVLDAAGGIRLKPAVGVDFFTFDRDETAPGVRCNNADRGVLARVVLLAVELDLQFGILFQRARSCPLTDGRKMQLAYDAVVIVVQREDVLAGLRGWQRVMQRAARDYAL